MAINENQPEQPSQATSSQQPNSGARPAETRKERLYEIIFEADTKAGKVFDVMLLIAILMSVLVVMLESVESLHEHYGTLLVTAEWIFTILFTAEYLVRLSSSKRPLRYMFSFYGIVDLLALLPTYFTLIPAFAGGQNAQRLTVIRALRLLRAFRIFKLAHMLSEADALRDAMWAARAKVAVFLSVVMIAVVIVGSAMHLIEGGGTAADSKQVVGAGEGLSVDEGDVSEPEFGTGFDSIPESMYWAVVTMTTVGYGDVKPVTALGKAIAAGMMLLGYCMIIVPTSIVSAELARDSKTLLTTQVCPECHREGHDKDARHCKFCGGRL
ncbi:MAG: ion transporter [Fuerstiella sp.]